MQRRQFLTMAGALGLTTNGEAQTTSSDTEALGDLHDYFLTPGVPTPEEEREIEDYLKLREEVSQGSPVRLRGRPKSAPTYRLVYWDGELNDPNGRLVGPLSLTPEIERARTYSVNAQILNFHLAGDDWKRGGQGLLTVDMLAKPSRGQAKTWQLAENFDVMDGGRSSLGFEYIVQDKQVEVPVPLVTAQPNLGLRFQLMKVREGNGFLKKLMKAAAFAANPIGALTGGAATALAASLPAAIRLPEMAQEGVAFAQAVYGANAEAKEPIWRGSVATYGIASGGGRLALKPGFWIVMDEHRQPDLRGVVLEDIGSRPTLTRDDGSGSGARAECDLNYLVLSFEIAAG